MPKAKIAKTASSAAPKSGNLDDVEYAAFMGRLQARLNTTTEDGKRPLFRVRVPDDIWPHYLEAFKADERQHHNCSACRHFLRRFGPLVVISDRGELVPALWDVEDAPAEYLAPVKALIKVIKRSPIESAFYSSDIRWGQARTGDWSHFAVMPHNRLLFASRVQTAGQKMAEKREDFAMLSRALAEYDAATAAIAVTLLEKDQLYRSEKVLGVAQWFLALHTARAAVKGKARDLVTWSAVASAPAGFCHVRSSMIGTLLADISAGKSMGDVAASFKAKMSPLLYQRPQAAPSFGNIRQAEGLIKSLGLERSLERRYLRLEEVTSVWAASSWVVPEERKGEVFGHLKPKEARTTTQLFSLFATPITWVKFRRDVLPDAMCMEIIPPALGNYCALTTAAHLDAPPLVQWDMDDQRNPVAHYVYVQGSPAEQWNLTKNKPARVTAVALAPHQWNDETAFGHFANGAIFILEGARDLKSGNGNALFPEDMKSELRPVRATIEAYSAKAEIQGREEASACGLWFGAHNPVDVLVSNAAGVVLRYKIDRWE